MSWKRMLWIAALTVAFAAIQLRSMRRDAQTTEAEEPARAAEPPGDLQAPAPTPVPKYPMADPATAPIERDAPASAERARARARRDALRAKIIGAQGSVPATRERVPRSAPAASPGKPGPSGASLEPGELTNRVGGHNEILAHLNSDFMPLAQECIKQAQERAPSLRGMLTLEVETVSDEKLGALVERAEVPAASEVQERELAECIRESAMTLTFPPSLPSGPEQFQLTLMVAPD